MKFKYLWVFFFIALYLASFEFALEVRAMHRGFSAHFISLIKNITHKKNNYISIRKSHFPFRSPQTQTAKPEGYKRFWMASASYAEDDRRQINELFPNIFCSTLNSRGINCQILNAAKAGMDINGNINQLKTEAIAWKPDFIVLYSMSLDVNRLSQIYLSHHGKSLSNIASKKKINKNIFNLSNLIEKQIENSTTYDHLRRYVGGYILLSSALHNGIGVRAEKDYLLTLQNFIAETHKIGATPILTTFATRYDAKNYKEIPLDEKLWFVRYNEYLSIPGWTKTISRLNNLTRRYAKKNNIMLLDVGPSLAGKPQFFTDYVHFTKQGHKILGTSMAQQFIKKYSTQ